MYNPNKLSYQIAKYVHRSSRFSVMHTMYHSDMIIYSAVPDVLWLLTACCPNSDCDSRLPSRQGVNLKLLQNENKLVF